MTGWLCMEQARKGAGTADHIAGRRVQAGPRGRVPRHTLRSAPYRAMEVG